MAVGTLAALADHPRFDVVGVLPCPSDDLDELVFPSLTRAASKQGIPCLGSVEAPPALEAVRQVGVENKLGGHREHLGLGHIHVIQEADQRSMMLIDTAEVRLDISECGLENAVQYAALLITEERLQ